MMFQDVMTAAGRVAGRAVRRNVPRGKAFVEHVVPAVVKPARALWNQVIGFVFIVLAVTFGHSAVRSALAGDHFRLLVSAFCTLLMAWFGLHSFLRARKISRS